MRPRDRRFVLLLFGAAALAWVVVGIVAFTVDPRADPGSGFVGAGALGVATAASLAPILWLLTFARHGRIAYRGDWLRAVRRGGWIGLLVAVFVVMRINGVFQPQIGLFLAALVLVAEVTLSRQ